jgi:hypothetical protein
MRALVTAVVGAVVAILTALAGPAHALDYDFVSLDRTDATLSQLAGAVPAINGSGAVAFVALVYNPVANRDEYVVFRSHGGQTTPVLNLTEALGLGSPAPPALNDAGVIALVYTLGPGDAGAVIVRISLDGSFVVLVRADQTGAAPYLAFAPAISVNGSGQVAALVTNLDATTAIVRLEEAGAVEIARSSPTLFEFSPPTLNDAGTVAFRAVTAAGSTGVYTGAGGALTNEATHDPCAASGQAPVLDRDGFVVSDCAVPLLFRARGGAVSVVVSGAEDPVFGRLTGSYSATDRGRPAFTAGPAGASTGVGLFTGNDPARDKVVRTGDLVLGLGVQDVRVGSRAINEAGQLALLLQLGAGDTVSSHVVLATPRRLPQSIDFAALAGRTFGEPPFVVNATASSGLTVVFAAGGACSIAGGTVTLLGAGGCTLTASQPGDGTYLPAADVAQTFSIARATQSIAFDALPARTFGDPPVVVSATASSGLPVSLSAAGACSLAGSLVTLAGAGSCVVTASQDGDASHEAAAPVSRTFTIARAGQAITFTPLPDRTFGEPPFAVLATASSGLPVGFSAAGSCSVAGDLVTLAGGGACVVTASQGGNADHEPAADVAQTFGIGRAGQTIAFAPLPGRTFGDPPFSLTATASSGLPVRFSATGACLLAGETLSLTGAGGCVVTASQGGDASYLPASDVAQTFGIARAAQTIAFGPLVKRGLADPPFAVSASASSGLPVSFTAQGSCAVTGVIVSPTGAGPCTITASQAGNADFEAAPAVVRAFSISGLILEATFNGGPDGFDDVRDAFRNTSQPAYASATWLATGGFRGGALRITVGGIDNTRVSGMSGGWRTTLSLGAPARLTLYFRGNLTQSPDYEPDEKSELLVSLDGALVAPAPGDYVAQLVGNGNSGSAISTGWMLYRVDLGMLDAGTHTLIIGGYNSHKTTATEFTTVLIDDVLVTETTSGARAAVDGLDFGRFKDNIRVLAGFGDRVQGSVSYMNAADWLQNQLEAAGYTVQHHAYTYQGQPRTSIYVTKVGSRFPDQMYIVSAHLDGRGGGGAANDDASGCALVLEAARALATLQTEVSVRFVFWNNEETGLNGSTAYRTQRAPLQGVESPPGSGVYPEPRWLGIIQHDQILFDHGLPAQPKQIPGADIDVEYQANSTHAVQSQRLANALRAGNQAYSTRYPAQVGSNMNYTDSVPFQNYTASVSVRDNQRVAEIGNGSNPHWHQPTDVYAAFSEDDFRLGFNAVQMTLGTVAELAAAALP